MRSLRSIALIVAVLPIWLHGCSISSGGPAFAPNSSANVSGQSGVTVALGPQSESLTLSVAGPTATTLAFGPASAPANLSISYAAGSQATQTVALPALAVSGATTIFAIAATSDASTTLGTATAPAVTLTLAYPAGTLPTGATYTLYALQAGAYVAVGSGTLVAGASGQTITLSAPSVAFVANTATGFAAAYR